MYCSIKTKMLRVTGRLALALAMLWALNAPAQKAPDEAPVASRPIVELEGSVSAVRLAQHGHGGHHRHHGMCLLEVTTKEGERVQVRLGPMRFLMEQDFSPEADDVIEVTGYQLASEKLQKELVAISVSLPGKKQTLKLRGEDGYPVWSARGGRHGRMGR